MHKKTLFERKINKFIIHAVMNRKCHNGLVALSPILEFLRIYCYYLHKKNNNIYRYSYILLLLV